jgi:lipase chaperone LimK
MTPTMTPTNDLPAELRRIADGILFGRPSLVARQAADRLEELERELAVWHHEAKRLEAELAKFDETAIEWWCEYQDLKAKARKP